MEGEKILWAGKPRPILFSALDLLSPPAVFCLVIGCTLQPAETAPLWANLAVRVLLPGLGLLGVLAPAAQRVARSFMLCAVTNRRALRLYPRFFTFWKTETYGAKRLQHMRLKTGGDGYGDILFGYFLLTSFTPMAWGFKDIPQAKQAYSILQRIRQQAETAPACTLPLPETPISTDMLTDAQRRTLNNAMNDGEQPCYIECDSRQKTMHHLLRAVAQGGLCLFLTWWLFFIYRNNGFDVRLAVTAFIYLCLLYLFVGNAAATTRDFVLRRQRFYVLTTHRALVLHPKIGVEETYPLTRYLVQEHHINPDGSGAVIMGYRCPETADVQGAEPKGFLYVHSVRRVEKLLKGMK